MPVSDKKYWFRVWFCFFSYCVLASLFIQLVLLPYVVPEWHGGNGLLKGHDWITYHDWGVALARFIRMGEWDSWRQIEVPWVEPRAISLVYAFVAPSPWALIPFNAFFHATTALMLSFVFMGIVSKNRRAAVVGSLPFLLFPSALLWTSQIHKDGANNFAFACYLLGWVLLYRSTVKLNLRKLFFILFLIGFGSLFSWYLRPYLGAVLSVCSFFFLVMGFSICLFQAVFRSVKDKPFLVSLCAASILVFAAFPIIKQSSYSGYKVSEFQTITQSADLNAVETVGSNSGTEKPVVSTGSTSSAEQITDLRKLLEKPVESTGSTSSAEQITDLRNPLEKPVVSMTSTSSTEQITVFVSHKHEKVWQSTPYVPTYLEDRAFAMSSVRNGFLNTASGTVYDFNTRFYSVLDLLGYLPRSVQLATLAPLPHEWAKNARTEYNSFFKKIVIFEMLAVYLVIPFFVVALFRYHKKREFYVLLLFNLYLLTLFGITVPNLGTLCRFRYFFLMTWVGLGASYAFAHKSVLTGFKLPKIKLLKARTA